MIRICGFRAFIRSASSSSEIRDFFEPSGGLFAPGYPLPPVEPERLNENFVLVAGRSRWQADGV
jgi:hypothetical protein